tara:strand:+ start:606 stop:911 length:306 start_codon:yes stop_codon:yes gene_type:complete
VTSKTLTNINTLFINFQYLPKRTNKDKGDVVFRFLQRKVCDGDTIKVLVQNVEALEYLVNHWGELGERQVEDDILKPFFEQLLIFVQGIVEDHEKIVKDNS